MTKKAEGAFLELHANSILRQYETLWFPYVKWLEHFKGFFSKVESKNLLSIEEGESFLRFSFKPGLSSLFFIYEIGSIFPTVAWHHIVKPKHGFSLILLNKPASFFPAFSFLMDRTITLIYWGEKNPILSPKEFGTFNLKNSILEAEKPDSVEVSTVNLVWPKSVYPVKNQELERWAVLYLFNVLLPPTFNVYDEVWLESPFIIIGEKDITIITLHKTLCSIDRGSIREIERKGIVNVKATIIDRDIKLRNIPVDIPQEHIKEFTERKSPCESIFIKRISLVGRSGSESLKLYKRYTVYPFGSIKLFKEEGYGHLLTAISIILRNRYLKSEDPFFITLTLGELKDKMRLLFRGTSEELGLRLLESREGLNNLVSLLEVYNAENSSFLYLHPAFIELFYLLMDHEGKFARESLLQFIKAIISRYYKITGSPTPAQFKKFCEELSIVNLTGKDARLRLLLDGIRDFYVPLSKFLHSPLELEDRQH